MSVNFKGCAIPKRSTSEGSERDGFIRMSQLKATHSTCLLERVRRAVKKSYSRGSKEIICEAFVIDSRKIGGQPQYYVKLKDCERLSGCDYLMPAVKANRRQARGSTASVKLSARRDEDASMVYAKTVHALLLAACEWLEDYMTRPV